MSTTRGSGGRGPSQRQLRVGELIRHSLSEFLLRDEIRDDDLSGVAVTVSEVRASPDLRNATAYVLPLGGANEDKVIRALNKHQKFIRGQITGKVDLKYMPMLKFEADQSFKEADHIEALLRSPNVARDLD